MDIDGSWVFAQDVVGDIADPEFVADGIVLFGHWPSQDVGGPELVVVLHKEFGHEDAGLVVV